MAHGQVHVDITMSLDGFVAGPNDSVDNGLGDGGERLHEWLYDLTSWRERHGLGGGEKNKDAEILDEAFERTGAVVMGRRMFDIAEKPWGDNPPFHMPVFVLTHHGREPLAKERGTTFTFVTEGIEPALEEAKKAAGEKDVSIAGGAKVIQQFLAAGLVDDLQLHVAPLLLGDGVRLFDGMAGVDLALERTRVAASPRVTHLKYRIRPG